MKTVLIIGIGAGDPEHVTVQAVNALNRVDVFFLLGKGPAKQKLIALRKEICSRFIRDHDYRFVEATSPGRELGVDYLEAVDDLNARKQSVFERLITQELRDGECGAFLVWGDPSLYDSTIRNVEAVAASGHAFDWEVIPGITSVQALTAKHRTTLNRIGRPVQITTGRRLAEGFPDDADSVVVMLDGENAYDGLTDEDDMEIFWGAYLGTPDEILVAGRLKDVAPEIKRVRAEARASNGWIMDCYLMRRAEPEDR